MRARMGWVVLLLVLACGRTEIVGDPSPVAIVDATPLAVVARELVSLDGARSFDPLGDPLLFAWEISQRPPAGQARLETSTGARTRFRPDRAGTWRVTLVVTTGTRRSEAATVSIEVRDEVVLPVAHAGDDQRGFVGDLFTLNGSQSRDPAGATLSYEWSMARPPGSAANLFGATTLSPTFIADRPGTYALTLQVKARNQVDTDDVIVTVGETNQPPVAVIALIPDGEVGAPVPLDGSRSTDPDGEPITFEWRATFPSSLGTVSNPMSPTPTFVANAAGLFTFELVVRDRGGLTGRTTGSVRIRAVDAGAPDGGQDAGLPDAGLDAGPDAGVRSDGGAFDLYDPGQVYLAGTVSPGSCDRGAIADFASPDLGATGFTCGFINTTAVIRPTDGRLVYLNGGESFVRVFHCDSCPYRGTYPAQVTTNDPIIAGTCPGTVQIGQFRFSPDGELLHTCSASSPTRWRDAAGAIRYDGAGDRLVALGAGGWILTDTRVVNPLTAQTRPVLNVNPSLGVTSRWSAPDAFLLVVNGITGLELWRVPITGVAQRVGVYPPLPTGVLETAGARLDRNGVLYRMVRESLSLSDGVVRCTIGGGCDTVYSEATNPRVKMQSSALVTGP